MIVLEIQSTGKLA